MGNKGMSIRLKFISVLIFFSLGSTWAVISPIGAAPDDDYHLTSIWCANGVNNSCNASDIPGAVLAPRVFVSWPPCFVRWPISSKSAKCTEEGLPNQLIATFKHNGNGTYPNLFYKTMNLFAGENYYNSIITMRFFNLTFASVMLFLVLVSSKANLTKSMLGSWGLVLIPHGIFLIVSTNPHSWTIIALSFFWAFIQNIVDSKEKFSRKNLIPYLGIFICVVLALGSRKDSPFYLSVTLLILFLINTEVRLFKALSYKSKSIIFSSLIIIGSFLIYLGSRLTEANLGFSFPSEDVKSKTPAAFFELLLSIPSAIFSLFGSQEPIYDQYSGKLLTSFSYGLSWSDFYLPSFSSSILLVVFFIIVTLNIRLATIQKILSLVTLFLVYMSIILMTKGSYGSTIESYNTIQFQPRYFIPLLLIFTGIALYHKPEVQSEMSKATLIVLSFFAATSYSVNWLSVFSRFTSGANVPYTDLDYPTEWLPDALIVGKTEFFVLNFILSLFWAFVTLYLPNRTLTKNHSN